MYDCIFRSSKNPKNSEIMYFSVAFSGSSGAESVGVPRRIAIPEPSKSNKSGKHLKLEIDSITCTPHRAFPPPYFSPICFPDHLILSEKPI